MRRKILPKGGLNLSGLFTVLILSAALINISQCIKPKPKTPKDFIEQYSAAWEFGKIDRIMSMKEGNPVLAGANIDEGLKEQIKNYSRDRERERITKEIKTRGMSYKMWRNTRYVSEKDHQDHIHVDVKVSGYNSSVVLVRQPDQTLKISEFPSMYKD